MKLAETGASSIRSRSPHQFWTGKRHQPKNQWLMEGNEASNQQLNTDRWRTSYMLVHIWNAIWKQPNLICQLEQDRRNGNSANTVNFLHFSKIINRNLLVSQWLTGFSMTKTFFNNSSIVHPLNAGYNKQGHHQAQLWKGLDVGLFAITKPWHLTVIKSTINFSVNQRILESNKKPFVQQSLSKLSQRLVRDPKLAMQWPSLSSDLSIIKTLCSGLIEWLVLGDPTESFGRLSFSHAGIIWKLISKY